MVERDATIRGRAFATAVWLSALLIAAGAPASRASAESVASGTIHGTVKDDPGAALPGITVHDDLLQDGSDSCDRLCPGTVNLNLNGPGIRLLHQHCAAARRADWREAEFLRAEHFRFCVA
jgi:hypothetical protein